jgi:hypothetical protein
VQESVASINLGATFNFFFRNRLRALAHRKRSKARNDEPIYPSTHHAALRARCVTLSSNLIHVSKIRHIPMRNPVFKEQMPLGEMEQTLPKIYLLERGFLNLYAHVGPDESPIGETAWLRK